MTAKVDRLIKAWVPDDFNIKSGWVVDHHERSLRVQWAEEDEDERSAFSWRAFLVRTSVIVGVVAVGAVVVLVGLGFADGVYWAVAHSCGIHIPENP